MCDEKPAVQALKFLQSEVAEVVDHGSSETGPFRSLLAHLLSKQRASTSELVPAPVRPPKHDGEAERAGSISPETLQARTRVFESLLEFYAQEAKEPVPNLVDMIDWYEGSAHE